MTLQKFIEENKGRVLGKEVFVYDSVLLHTRFPLATEPRVVEVILCLPWDYCFSDRLDATKIKDNALFYEWLKDRFFPLLKESVEDSFK